MAAIGRGADMFVSAFECLLRPIMKPKADRQEATTFKTLLLLELTYKSSRSHPENARLTNGVF